MFADMLHKTPGLVQSRGQNLKAREKKKSWVGLTSEDPGEEEEL